MGVYVRVYVCVCMGVCVCMYVSASCGILSRSEKVKGFSSVNQNPENSSARSVHVCMGVVCMGVEVGVCVYAAV